MLWIVSLLLSSAAMASPSALTYQGRILKSDGQPLQHTSVSFQFEIVAPNGTCVLYREQVNGLNMANSNGIFEITIGASHSYPAAPSYTILDSFNNASASTCDGGTVFNPIPSDGRLLRVQFHDGSSWRVISPDSKIRSVPYAAYSSNSAKLGNYVASDFILKTSVNGNVNCNAGNFLTWDAGTQTFGCAADTGGGGGGSGTVTGVTSTNSYLTVATGTTTPALTLHVGTAANTVAAGNDSRLSDSRAPNGSASGDLSGTYPAPTVAKIQGRAVDSTLPLDGQVMLWDNGNTTWKAQYVRMQDVRNSWGGTQMIPSTACATNESMTWSVITDRFTCQSIALNGSAITAGTISSARLGSGTADATTYLRGDGTWATPSASDATKLPLAGGTMAGTINMNANKITNVSNVPFVAANPTVTEDGKTLKWNNSSGQWEWFTAGAAGAGITSVNGQNGNAQTLAPTASATAYGFTTATNTHTLSIPSASTASVTAGTISKTEYDTFNAKLGTATSFSGDVSGNYNSTSVDKIKGKAVTLTTPAANDILLYDGTAFLNSSIPTCSAGNYLSFDGTVFACHADTSGSGTVTSVTKAATAGNPVTMGGTAAAPTIDIPVATGSANGYLSSADWTTFNGKQAAGNYLTSLNGDSTAAQTIAPTASATSYGFTTSSGSHTLSIPSAATASVTAGTISKTEYDTFNAKLGTSTSFSGDVSGNYNSTSVDKIKGKAVTLTTPAANDILLYNGTAFLNSNIPTCGAGNYLSFNGTVFACHADTSGSGTVTSVTKAATAGNPVTMGGTAAAPTIDIPVASGSANGYLSSADWTTFNSKQTAGTYLNSINGDSTAAQSIAPTASATSYGFTTSSGTHSLSIPSASTASVTAGTISKTEYDTFNAKLGTSTSFSGDVSGNYNSTSVDKIKGKAVTLTTPTANDILLYNGTAFLNSNIPTCGAGNYLSFDGTVFACHADTSGSGTVTSVTKAATAGNPITMGGTAAAPTIDIPVATTSVSGYLSSADWTTFNGKQAAGNYVTTLTGDVTSSGFSSGSVTTNVAKIQGRAVDATLPLDGQVMLWDNGNTTWKAQYVRMQDVRNSWGGTQMIPSSACAANESMTWSVITDRFACQAIGSLNASAITAGYINSARLGSGTADSTTYLRGDGAWTTPPSTNLASGVSGVLPVANGGTGANTLASGSLLVGAGTSAVTSLAGGSAGNVLYASGASAWSSATPDTAGLVDKSSAQTISGAKTYTNYVQMNAQNQVRLADADSSNYIALRSPATVAANVTLTLPDTAGGSGQVLSTDGNGVLSWSAGSSQWTTTGSDIYYNTGSVGIGTSGPWGILDVVKSGASSIVFIRSFGGTAGVQAGRANGTSGTSSYVVADDKMAQFTAIDGKSAAGDAGLNIFSSETHTSANQGMYVTLNTVADNTNTSAERVRILANGNVGVGITAPEIALDVNGAIKSVAKSNAARSIDFASGNIQYTSADCGATTMNNLKSGATYNLVFQGSTGGTCSFTAYSGSGTTGPLTVKAGTTNLTQSSSVHMIFSFMVVGSYVYVMSADGF